MKTPDEIKRGLECRIAGYDDRCHLDCVCCPYYSAGYSLADATKDALAYIQQLEAQVPKWISVEERLPETRDWVLVVGEFVPEGGWCVPLIAEYLRDSWRIKDECFNYPEDIGIKITHWMPLPEPPKEDDHAQTD